MEGKYKMKENTNLCEKISKIIPKSLDEVYRTSEKLEDIGINAKFLNRSSIYPHTYYYYLLSKRTVLYLYFKDDKLKYLSIYKETPEKVIICEKEIS